ncbi:helix-turn-helix domain-containing protein [Protofrankia coriariae]|uniref:HTH cro/C1-type domain-containing protein n=1 Tax=Protofrankia coriariae TaxID=1562887 RepID=A0ABR5F262_9ACTN|nr:helix-turn-helix transcriptional regulator [Protofrankia coriariae]KLL10806.1 hypothetical protein FrCorBMG51_15415 [Protofrankia coriariae]
MATGETTTEPYERQPRVRWVAHDPPGSASVGQIVGENLRRLREQWQWTQHEMAVTFQRHGLSWTRVRVAAIERGDRDTVDLGTLLLLSEAIGVAPAEFFAGDGDVRLSPQAVAPRAYVREQLSGTPSHLRSTDLLVTIKPDNPNLGIRPITSTEADEALARRLGASTQTVVMEALTLWGHSLTDERDRRVRALGDMEPNERQAHRGHITRELSREIEQRLAETDAREDQG